MFRPLTRFKQALSPEECTAILTRENRGILSVNGDDGYPYGMPMNHFYHADDGCIYFHCGRKGHRLDALAASDKVSFCVMDQGIREDGQWAYKVKSVIVFGRMQVIDDREAVISICEKLCRKFTTDEAYIRRELENSAASTLLLRLVPENICGKLVTEE